MTMPYPIPNMKLIRFLTAIVLAGTSLPVPAQSPPAGAAASVQVARTESDSVGRSIILPATVRPFQEAILYAKVAGYLKTLPVDLGDSVRQGQLLAEIEAPEILAELAVVQAEAAVAQTDYQRVREAQAKAPDLVVPQTVDTARGRFEMASANLKRIQTLLDYARLTAPFDGVITRRWIDPGTLVPAATSGAAARSGAVVTLTDFSKVRVQIAVPQTEAPLVQNGLPVTLTVRELPGQTFSGRLTRFAWALDETTKTMLAEVELPNPEARLRPGMFASARLEIERRNGVLTVPVDALLVEKARTSVFTVENGRARKISVKTGFEDGRRAEILDGLTAGQTVITTGRQGLTDGQPVQVTEPR